MANYHPNDEYLMQFAAGHQADALGVLLACHLEHCVVCQQKVKLYTAMGASLALDDSNACVSDKLLENTLGLLDESPIEDDLADNQNIMITDVPRPLQRFVSCRLKDIPWKGFTRGIKEFRLAIKDAQFAARFYKIKAGFELPEHTHVGNEYTVVLDGAFSDKAGCYHRGDFIHANEVTIHQPTATEEGDCICFAVTDAPIKFVGFPSRLLNPFLPR